MEIKEFIEHLRQHHFSLTVDGTRLILKADKFRLTEEEVNAIKNNREVIDYIRTNKEALIAYLSDSKSKTGNISAIYKLSPLQGGMMFHNLYDEQNGAYRNQLRCDLRGVDEQAFIAAWQYLLKQHSILRSSFHHDAFRIAVQCVHEDVKMPVELLDYRHLAPEEQQAVILAKEESDRQQGFDFKQAPLMRVVLMRLGDDHYRMLWSSHHILLDGWSMPVLIEEYLSTYNLLAAGETPAEQPEDRYEDYIRYLEQCDKEQEEAYWRQYLSGLEEGVSLPFIPVSEKRSRGVSDFREEVFPFGEQLTAQVSAYAKRNRITVNTVMQGVWAYLLSRYTGNPDVVFGAVTSGRPEDLPGVERRVGMYINTLPLRAVVSDNNTVAEWLRDIQQDQQRSRLHQYTALTDIQRWSGIQGELFDSIMVFQNYPVDEMVAATDWRLKVENLKGLEQSSNYPLLVRFSLDNNILLQLIYREEWLAAVYVQQIKSHFEQVLQQLVKTDVLLFKDIRLLNDEALRQLLHGFNEPAMAVVAGPESTLITLFEEQARRTPDNISVVYKDRQLSYRELDEQAAKMAVSLRGMGVGPERLVPVCVERSPEMIISILGILKAGGAYVPIDPAYPQTRIGYIIQDTAAEVVIAGAAHTHSIRATGYQGTIVDPAAVQHHDAPLPGNGPAAVPQNLAYVIYTSGSTGAPKGVMVEHRSIASYIRHQQATLNITAEDRILQLASYAFDASVEQIFLPLSSGAKLVLAPEAIRLDRELFDQYMDAQQITHLHATPAFLETLTPGGYQHLKRMISGGEACSKELAAQWAPFVSFYNKYGPTEAAVSVAQYLYDPAADLSYTNVVPIGKPMPLNRLYILDKTGQPLPPGVAGELHIAGIQVARGYLNNEEHTAACFVNNPFSEGEKMYKTGDMARWLPNGTIEYIGRADDQVKIRGYRIEPGEIVFALKQLQGVKQCEVIVAGNNNIKRLIAYVVADDAFDQGNATAQLKNTLPEYMMPAAIVRLEQIPLTANGKVDRKKLSRLDEELLPEARFLAPRNAMEEALAGIWQELLYVEKVGIHDNFFDLGGDSIITIQVVSRARRLGYELRVDDIFTYQTIARIGMVLKERKSELTGTDIREEGESGLLPIQRDYLQQVWPVAPRYNQSLLLAVNKQVSARQLSEVMSLILSHHDGLRFVYRQDENGNWQQSYGEVAETVSVADLSGTPSSSLDATVARYCSDCRQQLDIKAGKVLQVLLMETGTDETFNRLFITAHHLVTDGISWRILLEDLMVSLSAVSEGQQPVLGKKTASYSSWHRHLEAYSSSRRLQSQLDWWTCLHNAYRPLQSASIAVQQGEIKYHVTELDKKATTHLMHDISPVYHTEINDLLLTALTMALCGWSGRDELVVGLEGHGRNGIPGAPDVSRTVGWFTVKYPVHFSWRTGETVGALIRNVKEHLHQVPDKGIGYGVLRSICKDARLTGRSWDVLFNYLGRTDNALPDNEWFRTATESTGEDAPVAHPGSEPLSVNSVLSGEKLVVRWDYNNQYYDEASVAAVAEKYIQCLHQLITHCLEQKATGVTIYTPADYGLSGEVSAEELDAFLGEVQPDGHTRGAAISRCYRLGPLQGGMLFHNLYDGERESYRNQLKCDLSEVDENAFMNAWQYLLKHHSILRSSFHHDVFRIPVQCVHKEVKVPVELLDYRHLPQEEQQRAVQAKEESDRRQPFDFRQPPLMRVVLIRLDDKRYRMLWSSHHILLDGWSLPILVEEFLSAYHELATKQTPEEKPEDLYEDYIRYVSQQDNEKGEDYWRQYLSGVEGATVLPFVSSAAMRVRNSGTYCEELLSIGEVQTNDIAAYARRNRITTNTLMQGIWAFLLSRYTGEEDVVYGAVTSGRPEDLPGVEHRVGMYINTLPLRTVVRDERQVGNWLQDIQQDQQRSRNFQYSSLSEIQRWGGIQGELFDNILAFQNYPVADVIAASARTLKVDNLEILEQAEYPFYISVGASHVISVRFFYNAALIAPLYVQQISTHFSSVLQQIIRNDSLLIRDIQLLNDEDRHQLLFAFNSAATPIPYERNKTVVTLFEEQVARTPEQVAVVSGNISVSYRQLNEHANQLAHYLRKAGVRQEEVVPVCMRRHPDMLAAMLGIMKCGAAYLPLDPEHPATRIAFIAKDAAAVIALTDELLSPSAEEGLQQVRRLHMTDAAITSETVENIPTAIAARNLAYILYTSGSTGEPKGVMVEHGNLTAYLDNSLIRYNGDGSGSLAHLAYTFDAAVTAMFLPLVAGKTVFMAGDNALDAFRSLLLRTTDLDFLKLTPAHLPLLEDAVAMGMKMPGKIVLGGEALYFGQLQMLVKGQPVTIINEYGPTEATVGCCAYTLSSQHISPDAHGPVPIGKPFNHVRLYIVDKYLEPVPLGVPGELLIGGLQVARGYLNRPSLTAERFIDSPYVTGERLYRSGDIASWLPDGNILYHGRKDEQLKIHGYRIETGEIESALKQVEGIKDGRIVAVGSAKEPDQPQKIQAYAQVDATLLPLLANYLAMFNRREIQPQELHLLPNGLPILNANINEVRYLYQEIFMDQCYLRNGLHLHDDSCVIDVGANAGFSTLFFHLLNNRARIFSFEPIPEVFGYLSKNRSLYGIPGNAYQLAVSDSEGQLDISYYPEVSIVSGINESSVEARELVRAYIRNSGGNELSNEAIDELLDAKLSSRKITCRTKTISRIIQEERLDKVDLLKIDVENSEEFVIKGIDDADWSRIQSVIIEVHDVEGRLDRISRTLEGRGFHIYVEKEPSLAGDDILYNIFAFRPELERNMTGPVPEQALQRNGWLSPTEMITNISNGLLQRLPGYMMPTQLFLLDHIPVTTNGKTDRKVLLALPASVSGSQAGREMDETETQLAEIWKEVLEVESVFPGDNFFQLGGDSLLAIRLISLMRKKMQTDVSLSAFFELLTIEELARYIRMGQQSGPAAQEEYEMIQL
ncbi:amino acid adenylation domain-containing protein [Chitinophaga sp. G-6-1-13]|uniref:Amino acid adenylation domain-containing protein n=1 Tax=Chitinophaga fulva TaxID=2728842 RepID=A0A848GMF7_9BACT|nr:non-ribosomal peptide synthetase [Chitinophaga fulva]NML39137.1 amino acid adenylation domain-containing protein [Chitinophaga fulva]